MGKTIVSFHDIPTTMRTLRYFVGFNSFNLVQPPRSGTCRLFRNERFSTGNEIEWKTYKNRRGIKKTNLIGAGLVVVITTIGGYKLYNFLCDLEKSPKREEVVALENSKISDESFSFIAKNFKCVLDAFVKISIFSPQDPRDIYSSQGFGFVVSKFGEIITNSHLAYQARGKMVTVEFRDGRKYEGVIKYVDYDADLALVKIDTLQNTVEFLDLGSTEDLQSGRWVVAVKNLDLEEDSYALGALTLASNKEGTTLNHIRINPVQNSSFAGLTGGAVTCTNHDVIGFNLMTFKTGISLATPVEKLKSFLVESRKSFSLRYSPDNRYYLGISALVLTPEVVGSVFPKTKKLEDHLKGGLYVQNVFPLTPASKSCLERGDIIFKVDDEPFKSLSHLFDQADVKRSVTLDVYHDGNYRKVKITPAPLES